MCVPRVLVGDSSHVVFADEFVMPARPRPRDRYQVIMCMLRTSLRRSARTSDGNQPCPLLIYKLSEDVGMAAVLGMAGGFMGKNRYSGTL